MNGICGRSHLTPRFNPNHGWYLKNRGTAPVTITVKVSSWFDRLYVL